MNIINLKSLILYIFRAFVTYKQIYFQLIARIFDVQKYSYTFRLPFVPILREEQYSKTCALSIVKFKSEHKCQYTVKWQCIVSCQNCVKVII
jgi:hypothetical protein